MWQLIYNLHEKKPLVLLYEYSWDCCVNYSEAVWFDDASLFSTHKGLCCFRTYPIMESDTFSTLHLGGCLYSKLYPVPLVKTALHFSLTSSHMALRLALKRAESPQWTDRLFPMQVFSKQSIQTSRGRQLFLLCPIIWHSLVFLQRESRT